ncbi:MAG TPA: GH116 family glycosyl hydrolase, partial [Thermomicrobiales bacterium]|nr:GH116 family glycosyl hydrolase [Thermomicrobiales bacterium]
WSPFIPLEPESSAYPAIIFTFNLHNTSQLQLQGAIAATLQNAVGWDGITPSQGNRNPLYGGNTNRVRRLGDRTQLVMENHRLAEDDPAAGQMVLTALSAAALAFPQWTHPDQLKRFLEGINLSRQFPDQNTDDQRNFRNVPTMAHGPSPAGTTWNGALMVPYRLEPGEETAITFIHSWYFPNRYVNFDQFGAVRDYGHTKFWLGNAYATRFADATDVTDQLLADHTRLKQATRRWEANFIGSSMEDWLIEAMAAQGSLIRSPTTFRTEDGRFFGFEGSLGKSTANWNGEFGGSCPLNCTHVWNYEMALSALFPTLETSMRTTEYEIMQAPEGYIPHRVILPLYLRQLWAEPIGGPLDPALDGMLGALLKTYREVRTLGDVVWLGDHWPHILRLLTHIRTTWDPDNDGVLNGVQGNTYDIHFHGPNIFIGGLWLAALRAVEEMADILSEPDLGAELHELFERGRDAYDALLWNGEYYIQLLGPEESTDDQIGIGCHSDQLLGQWWAHLLDLGYILPEDHVRTTLTSIVRYNTQNGFRDSHHGYRYFADGDDTGLLICTWPKGGRPNVPVRYCDEVWTGIEYQVAAHCLIEGLTDEGYGILKALRARHNGERRNPYNEIECGDHYARAMAGWSVIEAVSGVRYNAVTGELVLRASSGRLESRVPMITGTGWGTIVQSEAEDVYQIDMHAGYGKIVLNSIVIDEHVGGHLVISAGGQPVHGSMATEERRHTITLP